jgi:uncharacterized protein with PQ loop repeat
MANTFYRPKGKKEKKILDKLIYPIGLIAPIMTIPQVLEVWSNKSGGVAVCTWAGYMFVSFFWILYGLHHKEKPIVLINFLMFVLDAFIVYGVLF